MSDLELAVVAVGAAMDAVAVAVYQGLALKDITYRQSFTIGAFFGIFQAVMPLIGFLLAFSLRDFIMDYDHYLAFALLSFLGIRMILESRDSCPVIYCLNLKKLTVLAFATSIDALAIGITFAFLDVDVFKSVTVIGIVTFALSFIATRISKYFSGKLHSVAEIIGGTILILIGIKILLEHLGIIDLSIL